MPTAFMLTDSAFPRFTDEQSSGERVDVIYNYLYMLLEQLRYSMTNLERSNFNDAGFLDIEDSIQAPLEESIEAIVERIADTDGNVASLAMTAQGLTTRMQNAEGNISALTQTASSLTSRIESAEGSVTTLSQTVNGLTLKSTNGETSSTLKLMSGNTQLSSATIKITGFVTFSDLKGNGTTTIHGANIKTGTISAITLEGCTFRSILENYGVAPGGLQFCYGANKTVCAGIRLERQGSYQNGRMLIYTTFADSTAFELELRAIGALSLRGGIRIFVPNAESTDETKYYSFQEDGIYYRGSKILSTGY